MKSFKQLRCEAREVWDRPNPRAERGESEKLSPAQKARARARARSAGRPYPNMVDNIWAARNEENDIDEATYQGREVTLNKPMPGDVKKSKVFVDPDGDGKAKKVNFGDKNLSIKKHIPARRKSFRARHNCDDPGPKDKARYWSCKAW